MQPLEFKPTENYAMLMGQTISVLGKLGQNVQSTITTSYTYVTV